MNNSVTSMDEARRRRKRPEPQSINWMMTLQLAGLFVGSWLIVGAIAYGGWRIVS